MDPETTTYLVLRTMLCRDIAELIWNHSRIQSQCRVCLRACDPVCLSRPGVYCSLQCFGHV